MDEIAVLASGPSASKALADSLRQRFTAPGCAMIVVSDAYLLAPWAYALVSQDLKWWQVHSEAREFAGKKFSMNAISGVEQFKPDRVGNGQFGTGSNSGLVACLVAQSIGAKRIELYGFDLHGEHFFGRHPEPLLNPNESRFKVMIQQFTRWNRNGVEVVNMTPGSAMKCFPFGAEKCA